MCIGQWSNLKRLYRSFDTRFFAFQSISTTCYFRSFLNRSSRHYCCCSRSDRISYQNSWINTRWWKNMITIGTQCTFRFQLRCTFIVQSHLTPSTMTTSYAIISFNRFFTTITSAKEEQNNSQRFSFLQSRFIVMFNLPGQFPSIQ